MKCIVIIIWDNETNRWYTDTDDTLCLNLESGSLDALVERVRMAVLEMLELNCGYKGPVHIIFETVHI